MRINRGIVKSEVLDWSREESLLLHSYFDDFESEENSLFDEDSRFYSGLVPWMIQHGINVCIENDEQPKSRNIREISVEERILQKRVLRDYQASATRKAVYFTRGIVQVPTGGGKTEIAASIYAHLVEFGLARTAVYLTPTVFLMEQTANRLEFFGFESVCKVGGGHKFKPGCDVYVFVVDSAFRGLSKKPVAEAIANADVLILDEAHHASAKSWTNVCESCNAPYRYAFTATVHDDPGKYSYIDLVLIGLIGPIICEVRSKELRDRGYLADPLVTMVKTDSPKLKVWDWDSVYVAGIVNNKRRNGIIMSLASSCYNNGSKVMVFIGRKKHGHRLTQGVVSLTGKEACFVHGNNTAFIYRPSGIVSRRRWSVEDVASYINDRDRAILVTTTVLDEGLDVPVIDVLIMGTAMKKYRRTVQRCGRGMRPKDGHNRVFIFDFYDNNHPFLEKHSNYRLWTYKSEIFEISNCLKETAEVMGSEILIDTDAAIKV